MKLLMGIPAPGLKGGPPTHLPYLVDYFQKEDNFTIQTFYYGSQNAGIPENILKRIINTLKALLKFIRLLIVFRPEIIHLNSAFDKRSILRDFPFAVICKLFSTPVLFKIHGSHYNLLFTKSPFFKTLIKIFFWGSSKVGVLSEFEREEFIQQFENPSKLIVVKNIVHFNCESIKINSCDKRFDALFVSRIEIGKGLEDLLLSMPNIIKYLPDFILGIAGSGGNMKNCMKLADDLKIQPNVKWLGYLQNENLRQVFNQSKIFVFTSHFPEGMPMSMIEAQCNGIPVITTRNRFARSYLKEDENVIFVDQENPDELSKKIIHLLDNKEKQVTMVKNNFKFLSNFTQDNVGKEFANIYKQMKNEN